MPIGIGALLGATALSGGINTGTNLLSQAWSQNFNAREAQKQRNFEEYMSSTSYQRAVADMQKAGINPASLSAGSMSASTPSGASASSSASRPGSFDFSNLVSSAVAMTIAKDKNFTQVMSNNIRSNASKAAAQVKADAIVESAKIRAAQKIKSNSYASAYGKRMMKEAQEL